MAGILLLITDMLLVCFKCIHSVVSCSFSMQLYPYDYIDFTLHFKFSNILSPVHIIISECPDPTDDRHHPAPTADHVTTSGDVTTASRGSSVSDVPGSECLDGANMENSLQSYDNKGIEKYLLMWEFFNKIYPAHCSYLAHFSAIFFCWRKICQ